MQILTVTHERAKPALHTSPPRVPLHCHLVFFCSFYSSLFSFFSVILVLSALFFFYAISKKRMSQGIQKRDPFIRSENNGDAVFPSADVNRLK